MRGRGRPAEAARATSAEPGVGGSVGGPAPGWGWTESALTVMVLVWGFNFAIAKHALGEIHPLAFNALRFATASLFVFGVLAVRGGGALPARRDVPRLLVLGLLGNGLYQVTFIVGLDLTLAGHASLMPCSPGSTATGGRGRGRGAGRRSR
jgi:hypothetical protein